MAGQVVLIHLIEVRILGRQLCMKPKWSRRRVVIPSKVGSSPIIHLMERWQSGLLWHPAKVLYLKGYHRFESYSFRKIWGCDVTVNMLLLYSSLGGSTPPFPTNTLLVQRIRTYDYES